MNNESALYFTDEGNGETALVFLHYFGGSSNTWHTVIDELKNDFRCIAIDLPGFRNSKNTIASLSVKECAKQVSQIIRLLSLQQYVLVGHSMGGKIAVALAAMQPAGLKQIILVAPSPPTPEPMSDDERKQLANAFGDYAALKAVINQATAQPLADEVLESAIADNLRASLISWNWWLEGGSREDISGQVATIYVPALIIGGEHDYRLSVSFLKKEMQQYFPFAKFREMAGVKHLIPLEAPVALAAIIKEFVG